MARHYCTRCGSNLNPDDNYCGRCGTSTGAGLHLGCCDLDSIDDKQCPICEGTGKCKAINNVPGPIVPFIAAVSLGIAPIVMSIATEKCKRCNGTGRI